MAYCGRDCALANWDYHKKMCRVIENEEALFADFVTLTSPNRKEALETQRMIRLCINRVASFEDPDEYLAQLPPPTDDHDVSDGPNGPTATLLYRIVTEAGVDVANEVLRHLENPPPPGKEATVAVGFRSLGDPVFDPKDIQKIANIYGCTVTSRVMDSDKDNDIVAEPNGEQASSDAPIMSFLNNIAGEGNWQFMAAGEGPPPDFPGIPQGAMQFGFPPIPGMNFGGGGPPDPGANPGGAAGPFPMPGGMPGGFAAPFPMPGAGFGAAGGDGANADQNMGGFQIPGLPPGVEAHVHVVNAGVAPVQQQHVPEAGGGNDAPAADAAGGDAANNGVEPNVDEGAANNLGANDNVPFVPEGFNAFMNNVLNNPGIAHPMNPVLFGGAAAAGADNNAADGVGDEAPDAEAEIEDVIDDDDAAAEPGAGGANDAGANMPVVPEDLNAFLNGIMNNGVPAAPGDDGAPNEGNEENNGNGDGGAPNPNPLAFLPNLLQGIQQAVAAADAGGEAGVNPVGNDENENAGGDGGGGGGMPMPMPVPEGGFQIPGLPGAQVFAGVLPIPMGGFDGAGDMNGEVQEDEDEPEEMTIED